MSPHLLNPYLAAAPAGFKPTDLSKLKFWYSAEYEKGFYSDNTLPSTIHDIAGLLNGAANNNVTLQYTGGDGGAACFRLPGTSFNTIVFGSGVYWSAINASDGFELMFYGKQDTGTTIAQESVITTTSAGGAEHCAYTDNNWYENFFLNTRRAFSGLTTTRDVYRSWDFWSKTNDWGVRLDTTDQDTTSSATFQAPAGQVQIGSGYLQSHLRIGGICGFSPILTNAERTSMRTFFAANPGGGVP